MTSGLFARLSRAASASAPASRAAGSGGRSK
jgi:hypothetical protein